MKVFVLISMIVAIASAGIAPIVIIPSNPSLIRSPQLDSAIVQSERLGGNFAYAIAEGQAFRTVSPVSSVSAGNIRAIDSLGVSYTINPINFPIFQNAPATIFQQPISEEEQREQQKQKDLLQKQKDQFQQESDRLREEEELRLLALQEQQETLSQDQSQDQINQQILLNAQLQDQQKQLLILQQEQQNLIGSASVIASVPTQPASGPTQIISNSDAIKPSSTITEDAVVIENLSLSKSTGASEQQPADTQTDDARPDKSNADNKSAY